MDCTTLPMALNIPANNDVAAERSPLTMPNMAPRRFWNKPRIAPKTFRTDWIRFWTRDVSCPTAEGIVDYEEMVVVRGKGRAGRWLRVQAVAGAQ